MQLKRAINFFELWEMTGVVTMNNYDVIIVEAGPAGLTAALFNARSKLKTLCIDEIGNGGQAAITDLIENYPGFPEGITGSKLTIKMAEQVERFGAEKITEKVQKLKLEEEYRVVVTNQSKYRAKAVIIASGASPRMLGCPGEIDFRGRGVSYCATCDGAFYEGSNILVIGGGNAAVEEAVYLTKFADKVTLVHRRQELRAAKVAQERAFTNPKIDIIWDSVVEKISGNSSVEKVILKNVRSGERREMFVDGVFVYAGLEPNSAWVKGVVRLDEKGNILTDENMCTNIKGVYAAGDVRRKLLRQVLTAASDGAIAAFHAERYIESQFYGS